MEEIQSASLWTPPEDKTSALDFMKSICVADTLQVVAFPGDPISKALPKWNKSRHPYTPKKTLEGRKQIATFFGQINKFTRNVAVACVFYRANHQRIDIDNMLKAILDGGTKAGIWDDDSQVTAIVGMTEYDHRNPRTVVYIGEHKSTMTRGENALSVCEKCGAKFSAAGNKRKGTARWCSRECRTQIKTIRTCLQCGKEFEKRQGSSQAVCSEQCRRERIAKRNRNRERPPQCKYGHLFDKGNTHYLPNGHRRCRKCQAKNAKTYRVKRSDQLVSKRYGDPGAQITIRVKESDLAAAQKYPDEAELLF